MRKIAIIIAIVGIGTLLILLFRNPLEITSLQNIRIGTLVSFEGIVSTEKTMSFGKNLIIDEIPTFCECKKSYLEKKVSVIGIVENYYSLRVRVLEIKIIAKIK